MKFISGFLVPAVIVYSFFIEAVLANESTLNYSAEGNQQILKLISQLESAVSTSPEIAVEYGERALILLEKSPDREEYLYKIYYHLSKAFIRLTEYQRAEEYADKLFVLARSNSNQLQIGLSCNLYGLISYYSSDFYVAISFFEDSLEIYSSLKKSELRSDALNNIGMVNRKLGRFELSLNAYSESIAIREKIGLEEKVADSLNNLGVLFRNMNRPRAALDVYFQVLEVRQHLGSDYRLGATYNNIGLSYAVLGEKTKSLKYFRLALEHKFKTQDKYGIVTSLINLGTHYFNENDHTNAKIYFDRALNEATAFASKSLTLLVNVRKSSFLVSIGDIEEALSLSKNALSLAIELGERPQQMNISLILSQIYEVKNEHSMALKFHQDYIHIKEQLLSERVLTKSDRLQHKLSYQHKLKEIKRVRTNENNQSLIAKKEITILYSVIFFLLTSLSVTFFLYRKRQRNLFLKKMGETNEEQENAISLIASIGQQITSCLSTPKIYEILYQNAKKLMPTDIFGVGVYSPDDKLILYPYAICCGDKYKPYSRDFSDKSQFAVLSIEKRIPIIINDIAEDANYYLPFHEYQIKKDIQFELENGRFALPPKSMIYIPFESNQMIGVVTVQSYQLNAYSKRHIEILKSLTAFAATALENSSIMEHLRNSRRKLERSFKKLETASLTDPLTGLWNRRFINKQIELDINKSCRDYLDWNQPGKRNQPPPTSDITFFLIDIDNFKEVNDRFGHDAGDLVLVQFSELLEKVCRDSDYCIRWGGEEFLIIVRFSDRNGAKLMAERIREVISLHKFKVCGVEKIQRTCSIGFASYPFARNIPEMITWKQVITIADFGLLAAKATSRNAWIGIDCIASSSNASKILNVLEDVQSALNEEGVVVSTSIADKSLIIWKQN